MKYGLYGWAVLWMAGLLGSVIAVQADFSAAIGSTGYQILLPDGYRTSVPPNAPKILLQADAPGGNLTLQVVQEPMNTPEGLASYYEGTMSQILGNFTLQGQGTVTVCGKDTMARRYLVRQGGEETGVLAVFFAGPDTAFIIHALFQQTNGDEIIPYLTSLQAPAPKSAPPPPNGGLFATPGRSTPTPSSAASVSPPPQTSLKRVPVLQSGYIIEIPQDWLATPNPGQGTITITAPGGDASFELAAAPNDATGVSLNDLVDLTLSEVRAQTGMSALQLRDQKRDSRGGDVRKLDEYEVTDGSGLGLMLFAVANPSQVVIGYGFVTNQASQQTKDSMRAAFQNMRGAPPAGSPAPAQPSVVNTPRAPAATPAPPATNQQSAPKIYYKNLVLDDSFFEMDYPAQFTLVERSEGQTQWTDESAPLPRVVMVIQSMMRSVGNTMDSVTDGLINQVNSAAAAKMESTRRCTLQGIPAREIHFTLDQGSYVSHFAYTVLDIEGPNVITVSFVGPQSQLDQLLAYHKRLQESVKPFGTPPSSAPALPKIAILNKGASASAARSPANSAAQPQSSARQSLTPGTTSIPSGGNTAASSREAWDTLNMAAMNEDWPLLVQFIDEDAYVKHKLNYAEVLCEEADVDPKSFQGAPLERFLQMLENVPRVRQCVRYLGLEGEVYNIREENPDMHLIMFRYDGEHSNEVFCWMRRINGKWVHTPN